MHLTILGAGPAGLAAGHFARRDGLPFLVLEAADRTGGNAVTFEEGLFRFDSGAHRFHDRDPEMTREVQRLLGPDLLACALPSQILHEGRWVDFPLSPASLLRALGPLAFARATASLVRARLGPSDAQDTFEAFAQRTYGADIAQRFLLGYSEKLWGLPCRELSPAIAGARLRGLSLTTFLREAVRGQANGAAHLDGQFYYPRLGFGMLTDRLAESCGASIRTGARVTRLVHDGTRITGVEVNRRDVVAVDHVCCTLPLPVTAGLLSPALPESLLLEARRLRFRSLLLVGVFLNRLSATHCGSVYFPDANAPMTRVYEPKNRSAAMAPPNRTMVVAEVPCNPSDAVWEESDASLIGRVVGALSPCGWFAPDEVLGGTVRRMSAAYPVLEVGADQRVAGLLGALERFENLHMAGRNGLFLYTHTHQMLRFGREVVTRVLSTAGSLQPQM